ncbi:MAG TPA: UDP-N-acetylglucosamine--N-acetylmuramyl-(pentapeptide) pyrophosphoryl-undecaprenol N-acetylglucosamine transferase [Candidatus Limnocylindrales bacterium]|nr:UDP-N-acetylglucosamine--N-acetylmuramyl-(pentapeptide) pyrophosphoryl-undecaprenol N-acetylglucosamine transferase [Candidatus Limnocylindrales bacterium]
MRLLIAGGGTGGHIYPALAVARSLGDRPNAPELVWLGGHRGLEASLVRAAGIRIRRLALRSLRTVDVSVHAVLDPIRLAVSVPQAAAILARERPAAIFTTGGYVAVPTLMAAAPLRIPVVLWDGNVVPGRAVRLTARLADAIAVSFEATGRALADAGAPVFLTGTPIRDVSAITRDEARSRLEIPADARVMLIFGGSQAVRRFNAAVERALSRLVERAVVLHVTGDEGYAPALAARERLAPDQRTRYRPSPFLRDDMLAALVSADLVVGRAGSSTLAEVTALGIPSVIVPYPHAAGHQTANARIAADAGAARLVADEDFDEDALIAAADLLADEAALAAMAAAARRLGRPGAADAVAEIVMAAAERRPLPDAERIDRLSREGRR